MHYFSTYTISEDNNVQALCFVLHDHIQLLHVTFYTAASILVFPICSHGVNFISQLCLQAIRIKLLGLEEVHTSNVYVVVVVGVLPSCCTCHVPSSL